MQSPPSLADPLPTGRRRPLRIDAGVVAHNEERTLARAVASLLEQELPPGLEWGAVWIVASGCTDGTVDVAKGLATADSRIQLVVEPTRRGKSHAVREVLRRAGGDLLALLNADAVAEPGAIAALVSATEGLATPFAIMARPVPPEGSGSWVARMVELLWTTHHELHSEIPASASGANLSDELLLLSLPQVPALREGIINDGAYLGVSLSLNRGGLRYAPAARVRISVPGTFSDFLRQRRRIRVGYDQLQREFGVRPETLSHLALSDPGRALRLIARSVRSRAHPVADLAALVFAESTAAALAIWDSLPPRRDHVNWDRIADRPPVPGPSVQPELPRAPAAAAPTMEDWALTEARLTSLLRVANRYRAALSVEEVDSLLPAGAPEGRAELLHWLGARPDLARLEGNQVFPPSAPPAEVLERRTRAARYRAAAEELVGTHLAPVLPCLRCLAITGSTAYGAPEAGDDLDFFVVARRGSMWVFLTYAYLAVRFRFRPNRSDDRPMPCFNYVLDDRGAVEDFTRPQGFLFAREALTARILRGEPFYGSLLAGAPWIGEEIPRLYAARRGPTGPHGSNPAPLAIRALNSVLFLPMAAYLQMAGLLRNAASRRSAGDVGRFDVRTRLGRLAFESAQFERIRDELTIPVQDRSGWASNPPLAGPVLEGEPISVTHSLPRENLRPPTEPPSGDRRVPPGVTPTGPWSSPGVERSAASTGTDGLSGERRLP